MTKTHPTNIGILNTLLAAVAISMASPLQAATPSNDSFAAAITLSGSSATTTANNALATTADLNEPFIATRSQTGLNYRTVWWKWTAPSSGSLKLSMQGTTFTWHMLGIYVGTTAQNLKTAAFVDQATGVAELNVPVIQGVTYHICVGDGVAVSPSGGPLQLNLTLTAGLAGAISPLAAGSDIDTSSFTLNDRFANAVTLTGSQVTAIGYNRDATTADLGEPFIASRSQTGLNYRTVWWKWTAPSNGSLKISMQGTKFNWHMLGAYVGTKVPNLKTVAFVDQVSGVAELVFPVVQGVTYHICAGDGIAVSPSGGPVQLNLTLTAGLAGAVSPLTAGADIAEASFSLNDKFANAIELSGNSALAIGYNRSATSDEVNEPFTRGQESNRRTVWWKWTAPSSGTLNVTLQGTTYPYNELGVYVGTRPANLKRVSYSRSSVGTDFASIEAPVVSGVVYYICVGGDPSYAGIGGSIQLNLSASSDLTGAVSPLQPDADTSDLSFLLNDRFQDAVTLEGNTALAVGYHGDSTMEDIGEPFLEASGAGHTLWWKWTAPFNGTVELSMQGTTFGYQMLGLYTGSAPNKLTSVTDESYVYALSGVAKLKAAVRVGTEYYICVGSRQENINIWGNSILRLALARSGGGGGADKRPGLSGAYHGHYETPTEAGILSVRVKKSSVTGHLLRSGQRISLRGSINAEGRVKLTSGNVNVEITLPASSEEKRLSVTLVESGKGDVSFELLPAARSTAVSGWRINALLVAADSATGHGLASGLASTKGSIRFRGMLADGSKIATSAPLVNTADGLRCLMGAFVRSPATTLVGSLPFDASSGSLAGNVAWVRQQGTLGRSVNSKLQVAGQRWTAVAGGRNALNGGTSETLFDLEIRPGLKLSGKWPTTNVPLFEPAQVGLSIKVNTQTGRFQGSIPAQDTSASKFHGIILPQAVSLRDGEETRAIKAGGFSGRGDSSSAVEISIRP